MPIPSQSISVTDLDFDQIKANLIEYFKANDSPFKDWDYSASGLNTLLDVLSHNTYYNAILAHMAVNESFIDTAQIRANVVSAAKLIGYTPSSYSAASASVNITAIRENIIGSTNDTDSIIINRGSKFFGLTDGVSYEFTNTDDVVLTRDSTLTNTYRTPESTILRQGYIETKRIQINDRQSKNQYIIDDKNIDTKTLKVLVYPPDSRNTPEIYYPFTEVKNVDGNSPIYFIYENYNGNYVISFGNNVFGKKPNNLNILEISYIATNGADANGVRNIRFSNDVTGFNISVETTVPAFGGSYEESISSIKYNAPLNYISQNRAVTADDYEILIKKNFQETESISVWGGEENNPPQYGKVFISVKKKDTFDPLTQYEKTKIYEILKPKKVLTILPEIVDAEYINVVLDVLFKYNANLTKYSKTQLENLVKSEIASFNDSYLNKYDGIFRHSFLSRVVDQVDPSILNSHIRVFVSKSFTVDALNPQTITLDYGTELTMDDGIAVAASSPYVYRNTTLYIGDRTPDPDINAGPNIRTLYNYYYDPRTQEKVTFLKDIGSIDLSTGKVIIENLNSDDGTTVIHLDLIPISNDIAPKRNQLITINTTRMYVYGEVDKVAIGGAARLGEYNTFKRDR